MFYYYFLSLIVITYGKEPSTTEDVIAEEIFQFRTDQKEEIDDDTAKDSTELPNAEEEKQEEIDREKQDDSKDVLKGRSFGLSRGIQDILKERMKWMRNRYQLSPGGPSLPAIGGVHHYPEHDHHMGGPDISNVGVQLPNVGGSNWEPWQPPVHPWSPEMAQHQKNETELEPRFLGASAHGLMPNFGFQGDVRMHPDVQQHLQPGLPLFHGNPQMPLPSHILPPMLPEGPLPPPVVPLQPISPPMMLTPGRVLPMGPQPIVPYPVPHLMGPQPMRPQPMGPQPMGPQLMGPQLMGPHPMGPLPEPQHHQQQQQQMAQQPMEPPPQAPNMIEHPFDETDIQRDVMEEPEIPVQSVRINYLQNKKRSYPSKIFFFI